MHHKGYIYDKIKEHMRDTIGTKLGTILGAI